MFNIKKKRYTGKLNTPIRCNAPNKQNELKAEIFSLPKQGEQIYQNDLQKFADDVTAETLKKAMPAS